MYKSFIKPLSDILFALACLIFLSPILLIVFFMLSINNKGQAFFKQKRPGKNEKIFEIIKFKTMADLYDNNGQLLPDKDRITPIGSFIRKTSLDELPQLINVLKGDMSFVGPRPLLVEYLPLYNSGQKLRHKVRPGITGWAQVNGRNNISWEEKFKLDIWYVNNINLFLDFKILYLTLHKVIQSKDINKQKEATTSKFKGNKL